MAVISDLRSQFGLVKELEELGEAIDGFSEEKACCVQLGVDCVDELLGFLSFSLPKAVEVLTKARAGQSEQAVEMLDRIARQMTSALASREYLNPHECLRAAEAALGLAVEQSLIFLNAVDNFAESGKSEDAAYASESFAQYSMRYEHAQNLLSGLVRNSAVIKIVDELDYHQALVMQGELAMADLIARLTSRRGRRLPL